MGWGGGADNHPHSSVVTSEKLTPPLSQMHVSGLWDPERTHADTGRRSKLHANKTLDLIGGAQITHQCREKCS